MKFKEQFGKALQKAFDTGVVISNALNAEGLRKDDEQAEQVRKATGDYYYRRNATVMAFLNASTCAYVEISDRAESLAEKIGYKLDVSRANDEQRSCKNYKEKMREINKMHSDLRKAEQRYKQNHGMK